MPKREDEFYASEKLDLRYCSIHKRYYKVNIGCQICGYEYLSDISKSKGNKDADLQYEIQNCPACGEVSLYLNNDNNIYECLNINCRQIFTQDRLNLTRTKKLSEEIKEEYDYKEVAKLQKCPGCKELSLLWNDITKQYECQNINCKCTFTEDKFLKVRASASREEEGKESFFKRLFKRG